MVLLYDCDPSLSLVPSLLPLLQIVLQVVMPQQVLNHLVLQIIRIKTRFFENLKKTLGLTCNFYWCKAGYPKQVFPKLWDSAHHYNSWRVFCLLTVVLQDIYHHFYFTGCSRLFSFIVVLLIFLSLFEIFWCQNEVIYPTSHEVSNK
jgi:hypothetical protein